MFNLDDYETVAMLNRWFVENYPMGRTSIEITYHDVEKGYITCKAEVYRDVNDPNPATSNIAHGVRDQYIQNMRRFYAEDIASSALGRAITLLKGGQTATRDDMEKVGQVADKPTPKPFNQKLADKIIVEVEDDPWTVKAVAPAPSAAEAVALVQDVLGATKIDKDIPFARLDRFARLDLARKWLPHKRYPEGMSALRSDVPIIPTPAPAIWTCLKAAATIGANDVR